MAHELDLNNVFPINWHEEERKDANKVRDLMKELGIFFEVVARDHHEDGWMVYGSAATSNQRGWFFAIQQGIMTLEQYKEATGQ